MSHKLNLSLFSKLLALLNQEYSEPTQLSPVCAEIKRAKNSSENLRKKFVAEAQESLSQASDKFNKANLRQIQLEQKLQNTNILSPVDGAVSKVNVSTIGEVVSSGETLFEIIPLTDELVLEVEVRPEDVAFVYEGQKARISLSSFDPSIYVFER